MTSSLPQVLPGYLRVREFTVNARLPACASTHRKHRHFLVFFVARDALRAWIQFRLAVHGEEIVVMAVVQRHLQHPIAIRLAFHGMRIGMPVIEVADNRDVFGLRGQAMNVTGLSIRLAE